MNNTISTPSSRFCFATAATALGPCSVVCLALFLGLSAAWGKDSIQLQEVAGEFTSPVALLPIGDSGQLLVADQMGVVYVLNKEGKRQDTPFLDLRDRIVQLNQGFDERGLLGLALHPKYKENHRLFVYYSAPLRTGGPDKWDHTSRIVEFKMTGGDSPKADPKSERILMEIDQPYFNHNGGCLSFGPDGYLYVALGDGGNSNDTGRGHSPQGNGQDTSNLLGKILRLDINKGEPYGIPTDNPFVKGKGRPEIWAYGLRNPWRISFDRGGNHELFAADVGQTLYEEVNVIVKGGNYGWNIREGTHCFDPKNPKKSPEECPKEGAGGEPLIDPIFEYKNVNGWRNDPEALGISVTGGYVYRGKAFPQLQGQYVFGDWSRSVLPEGVLLAAKRPVNKEGRWTLSPLEVDGRPNGRLAAYVTAFGEDADGELYVLTNGRNSLTGTTGKVFKMVPPKP